MKLDKLTTLLLISFFSLTCYTQNKKARKTQSLQVNISGKKIVDILSFFSDVEPGGTLLVSQNGQHIASAALGKSNLELDTDMKMDNVFNIASATKPFTAVAIFKLIEDDKISLDDKISKIILDFPDKGREITVGHLLSHSSGMDYKMDENERNRLKKAIVLKRENDSISITEYFTDEKFDNEPGIKYDYNNTAYQILGYIIEEISGKPYEEYLKGIFFEPLNMKSTQLESSTKIIKNRATGYDSFNGNDYQIRNVNSDDSYFYSAGGLMSTVEDLSIWYNALMNYKIISKNSLQKLTTPIKYKDGTYAKNGYGFFTGNLNGNDYVLHDGLGWGYGSMVLYFPATKLFIGHLRNCGYGKYDVGLSYSAPTKIASTLLDSEYFNKDYTNKVLFKEYVGVYRSALSQKDKIIVVEKNKLYLESRFGLLQLMPINKNTFFVERNNETLIFTNKGLNVLRGASIFFEKI